MLSRINKLDREFLYRKNLSLVSLLRSHVTSLLSHHSLSARKNGGHIVSKVYFYSFQGMN